MAAVAAPTAAAFMAAGAEVSTAAAGFMLAGQAGSMVVASASD
jgi:hypothetical protein